MKKYYLSLLFAGGLLLVSIFTFRQEPGTIQSKNPEKEQVRTGDVAIAWNKLAYEIAYAEDQFLTFKGHRAFSMMHLAMHDALNSIEPRYQPYATSAERPDADPVAATAQAAYEVMVSQYPDKKKDLKEELTRWLSNVSDEKSKDIGVGLGRTCAENVLEQRKNDGWDNQGEYSFHEGPGIYQTTGTWDGFVLQPGFRSAKPFFLKSPSQFRSKPPPSLSSDKYAEAFNEVKRYGSAKNTIRSDDQTGYAVWWMEFIEGSVNRLARQLAEQNKIDLWTANRMFAYLNVALYDGYIAVWDGKYEYNHWRPVTAIHQANNDSNSNTEQDTTWKPLRPTAPFPDYPSAHAEACAASFGVLEQTFGEDYSFTMETNTAPEGMPTRKFNSFREAAEECADSRIQLGWHFRYAADEGLKLGRRVVGYLLDTRLNEQVVAGSDN